VDRLSEALAGARVYCVPTLGLKLVLVLKLLVRLLLSGGQITRCGVTRQTWSWPWLTSDTYLAGLGGFATAKTA
jgi:hypothetical protein